MFKTQQQEFSPPTDILATCGIAYILRNYFKALNGLVPPYLPHLLYSYSPPSDHLSLVFCPFPRYRLSTVRGRSFSVNAPKVWNSLPLTLRNLSSLSTFKTQLCVCIVYLGVQMFCLALSKVTLSNGKVLYK